VKLSKGHFLLEILVASGSTVYRTTDNYLSDLDHGKVLLTQGTDNSNYIPGVEEQQKSVGVGCSLARSKIRLGFRYSASPSLVSPKSLRQYTGLSSSKLCDGWRELYCD
jgi:hypothetical protein